MVLNMWRKYLPPVTKCDLCGGDPECVKFCVQKALEYVPVTLANVIRKRRALERIPRLIEIVMPRVPR